MFALECHDDQKFIFIWLIDFSLMFEREVANSFFDARDLRVDSFLGYACTMRSRSSVLKDFFEDCEVCEDIREKWAR